MPAKDNEQLFMEGGWKSTVGRKILSMVDTSESIIYDLETSLCDKLAPVVKCRSNLYLPMACVNGLQIM